MRVSGQGAEEVVRRIGGGEARDAAQRIATLTRRTPLLTSRGLSEACGGQVVLKAENLQRTGSFKLRGAGNRIARLTEPVGVVAGSAGNHGQSLAYAARARGIPCEVFMPREAPVAKVAAVQAFGGIVDLSADSVDDAVARAIERAQETGAAFVHPFDDPDVILGQATLGLELLDDVPDLDTVVVPVGGGGLISGIAGTIKEMRPRTRVIGVQASACAAFPESLAHGEPEAITPRGATIADGIAVKRPGEITLQLVERWVDEIVVVDEDETADAMVWLLERSKLVVEGGGAVGVAALLVGAISPSARGATCVVLSGGNVDAGLLAQVAQRHEAAAGRRLRLFTRISDRPGALAALLTAIAQSGGNVVHAAHVREAAALHVRETAVEITLETRGPEHGAQIVAELIAAGYEVQRLDAAWPAG
ncbi:MAG TPA: threonine ammonia-lyase [Solirubrobacteraceae bacterium]|nr:threonine ammonia-lyase [Solirubrobacteraceae bacterium]